MTDRKIRIQKHFLEEVIELLRIEMIQVGTEKGLSNPDTILISQRLDIFISEYQKLFHQR